MDESGLLEASGWMAKFIQALSLMKFLRIRIMEIIEYFFDHFWHFVGGLVYISCIGFWVAVCFDSMPKIINFKNKKKGK